MTTQHISTGLTIPDGTWTADRKTSDVGFTVKGMWGMQTVRGLFSAYEAALTVADGAVSGTLTIEAASLDTGHKKRDEHLLSADFFDVEQYPKILFTTTAVAERPGGLIVSGDLALGTSRVRLQLPLDVDGSSGTIRLHGVTTVSRQAAGLGWNRMGMIRGDARLHANLTFRRTGA